MKKIYTFLLAVVFFNTNAQSLYFPPLTGNTWDTISPQSLSWCQPKIDSLYAFLDTNNTKAFILLKDGKIVLEKYFGTYTQATPWQWASAGKTITSFMVGMAQQEGYLSISDTTSEYLYFFLTLFNDSVFIGLEVNPLTLFCTKRTTWS